MDHLKIAYEYFLNMNFLTVLSFIISLFTFSVGFYAYGKGGRTKKSRLTLVVCIFMGIWVLAYAFIYSADPETSVWFWYYISALGFLPIWPVLLHFLAVLAEFDKMPGKIITLGLNKKTTIKVNFINCYLAFQYVLTFVYLIWLYSGDSEPLNYYKTPYGLCDNPPVGSMLYSIYLPTTIVWYISGVIFLVKFRLNSNKKNVTLDVKKQSQTVSITGVIFGTCTIISNIFLPLFQINFPAIGPLFICIWILCIALATVKYNMGLDTEQIIGQKAFKLINEPMFVTNADLEIIYVNDAFHNIFMGEKNNLFQTDGESLNLATLFVKEADLMTVMTSQNELSLNQIPLYDTTRHIRFFNINTSCIYNHKILERILFVFSDITDLANQKELLEQLIQDRTTEVKHQLSIIEQYTKSTLVKTISAGKDPTVLKPVYKEKAILFANLQDFSKLSFNLEPEELFNMVNQYYSIINKCICNFQGEIEKLSGNEIMAIFDSPDDAVNASIAIMKEIPNISDNVFIQSSDIIKGIGISYGKVIFGNLGSKEKFDLTFFGDPVTTARKLTKLTKFYNTSILVSNEIATSQLYKHHMRFIDTVLINEQDRPLKVFEVYDYTDANKCEIKDKLQPLLSEIYIKYARGEFEQVKASYKDLLDKFGEYDQLLSFYYKRICILCEQNKQNLLSEWQGIYKFENR